MENEVTVTPSTTPLGRFKIWSGIVAISGWTVGSLLIVNNFVGLFAPLVRNEPALLAALWPLGQGILFVGFAEALRRHRRELASLDPGALEPIRRVLETETRIWQVLVALVLFNFGVFIVLDLFHVLSNLQGS